MFFPVSMTPADFHCDKTILFSGLCREFGAKIIEIKVGEINAPVN